MPFISLKLFSGDILEIGAQWAIAKRDIPVFERYMAQLKCYYMDYKYDIKYLNVIVEKKNIAEKRS